MTTKTTADNPCLHETFHANFDVIRLTDTGRYQAQIQVWCQDCDEPFVFPDQIPIGVDLNGTARNVDGTELRIAVRPRHDRDVAVLVNGGRP